MGLQLVTSAQRPDLLQKERELNTRIWPEFMFHDAVSNRWFSKLYELFPEYQFWLIKNDKIVGIGNSIPLAWQEDPKKLPEEGWDWAIEKGFRDYLGNKETNVLCGLLIAVAPEYRGVGISSEIIKILKSKARQIKFENLIIPVRPSLKSNHPLVEMSEYVHLKREDGQLYDPWLRVHQKCGAKIIKVCNNSMKIRGSIADWENWTGMEFPESAEYIIPGALVPVKIDLDKDTGEYMEPNVWVLYEMFS